MIREVNYICQDPSLHPVDLKPTNGVSKASQPPSMDLQNEAIYVKLSKLRKKKLTFPPWQTPI